MLQDTPAAPIAVGTPRTSIHSGTAQQPTTVDMNPSPSYPTTSLQAAGRNEVVVAIPRSSHSNYDGKEHPTPRRISLPSPPQFPKLISAVHAKRAALHNFQPGRVIFHAPFIFPSWNDRVQPTGDRFAAASKVPIQASRLFVRVSLMASSKTSAGVA
ncbi:hypothetical protein HPB47_021079 [Ixodes persulcatus]|uniref:Uncharacterized protein n=1 Tax=Ixodes persulcatus TaxID=34615 RepID=A0AC60QH72_IXOPE|nr:hypothetical protein HPB47_021079 [Ixodes persulcatus]